jgi:hypothetical protein
MQQNHELEQVRARLLPERLLAATKQVGHQGGNAVGERVRIEVVVQRIVPLLRREADLDVVVAAVVTLEDVIHIPAEVSFDVQDEAAGLSRPVS